MQAWDIQGDLWESIEFYFFMDTNFAFYLT